MSVTLRKKRLKNGRTSLWLDIYDRGKRKGEMLGIYLTGDRKHDRALWRIAHDQRHRRELEVLNSIYDFQKDKSSAFFLVYAENYLRSLKVGSQANYWNMLAHLEKYKGREIRFTDINGSYCEGLKEFLLQHCKPGTVVTYLAKLKRLLNLAVDDGVIRKKREHSLSSTQLSAH